MKRNLLLYILATLLILGSVETAFASETTGTLSTGVGSNDANGMVLSSPAASPAAGSYSSTQSVTFTAAGSSSIHYTTNGVDPTCSTGTTYSGAISVSSSTTIEAISCYANSNVSSVGSYAYSITAASNNNNNNVVSGGGGGGGGGGAISTTSTTTVVPTGPLKDIDLPDTGKDAGNTGSTATTLTGNGGGPTGNSLTLQFSAKTKVTRNTAGEKKNSYTGSIWAPAYSLLTDVEKKKLPSTLVPLETIHIPLAVKNKQVSLSKYATLTIPLSSQEAKSTLKLYYIDGNTTKPKLVTGGKINKLNNTYVVKVKLLGGTIVLTGKKK